MTTTDLSSTRIAVTEGLLELAEQDERIVLVCADSLGVMKGKPFKDRFPDRVIDVGIAEQNAVALASGLASSGMIPYVVTYGVFITMRACEQVRSFVGYPGLNVKLVGANGGMAAGEREGVTHQALEDIGITRMIPGMTVVVPADAGQTRQAIIAVANLPGPSYVRIGSGRDPVVYPETEPFELGKVKVLRDDGNDVVLFGNGVVLNRLLAAADTLKEEGFRGRVVEVHTVKPLDRQGILDAMQGARGAVTVEDHWVNGGLGSAVAECLCENGGAPLVRLGLQDRFPESGDPDPLLDKYGMSVADIVGAARKIVSRRTGTSNGS